MTGWTQFFLTDRSVELVIDGSTNPKYSIETGIPQELPASLILFLISISGVFSEIESRLPEVICLSFMDDLGFLSSDNSVIEIRKILEKSGKMTLTWGKRNVVTYDIGKTEAVLFFKARKQKLLEQLIATLLRFGGQAIRFNQEATR